MPVYINSSLRFIIVSNMGGFIRSPYTMTNVGHHSWCSQAVTHPDISYETRLSLFSVIGL